METSSYEDGFNVVTIRCDGCGREIAQPARAESPWFHVRITPLARDEWNEGEPLAELDFCSTDCFRTVLRDRDPVGELSNRD